MVEGVTVTRMTFGVCKKCKKNPAVFSSGLCDECHLKRSIVVRGLFDKGLQAGTEDFINALKKAGVY